jgi:hypothetical protein
VDSEILKNWRAGIHLRNGKWRSGADRQIEKIKKV